MFTAYVAFELAWRAKAAGVTRASLWLAGGAVVTGSGVWATACIDLLAVPAAEPPSFHLGMLIWTWLASVGVTLVLLDVARRQWPTWTTPLSGLAAGVGLLLLNALGLYTLAVDHVPLPALRDLGVAAAVALPLTASALTWFRWREVERGSSWVHKLGPILLLALAQVGSQSAMTASVSIDAVSGAAPGGLISATSLGVMVVLTSVVLLAVGLFAAAHDARMQSETFKLAASLREANDQLQRIAYEDPLTKLPNRSNFEDRLYAEVARCDRDGRSLAVLFIDLDGFKPVNDSYGHPAGDAVLRQIGQRLRALARASDAVARVGGDEFLMMIDGPADASVAASVAQRILDAVEGPCVLLHDTLQVSCSIGIAMYPQHGPGDKLLANADAAMYSAKRSGGSTFAFFDVRMDVDVHEQIELLRDLRSAIDRRELEMFYQPKVHARSGQIAGCEALIRWRHPVRGMVPPAVFIPIAERFGLISALGDWVIDDACRQIRAWMEQGLRMRVAVNLSVQQLRHEDLVDRIREALFRHRVEPGLLMFEITESVMMEDPEMSKAFLEKLARLGVSTSIDDFGTGHSALAILRKLRVKQLKIDRLFVKDLDDPAEAEDARAIVDAVVHMAHALGLKVVAEGVETEAQRRILLELNCDEFQGYLFAKPMSATALKLWAMDGDGPSTLGFRASLFGDLNAPRPARELARLG